MSDNPLEYWRYGLEAKELLLKKNAEIERLQYEIKGHLKAWDIERAEIEQLRAALKPFADAAEAFAPWDDFDTAPLVIEHGENGCGDITMGDLRRAAKMFRADGASSRRGGPQSGTDEQQAQHGLTPERRREIAAKSLDETVGKWPPKED